MALRWFAVYALLEIAAFVAMAMTLGFAWAVLITIGAGVLGFLTLRRQGRKVIGELRRAANNEVDPRTPLADTAVVAASTLLLVIPGVVSTVVGMLMLFPPTRRVLRPLVIALGARRVASAMDRAGLYATGAFRDSRVTVDGTVIDGGVGTGGVVDGVVVDVPGTNTNPMTGRRLPPTR
ncbi:FxsA family protein [Gordonia aurantiaca]|uniref:FxsA family protein n=1 Tax=Gordonia sp. B21 TaxID=3151852 RepID=UPI0032675D9D